MGIQLPHWVWIGAIALSCVAGMVNVVGFLGFEHQAVSHLTGTTSQLGMALVQHDWRSVAHLLFANWLNYYVYQGTPYEIDSIGGEDD